MNTNPYRSPDAAASLSIAQSETSPWAWWVKRQVFYNRGLVVAGFLAFIGYVIVCLTLLPRVLDPSEIEVSVLTTLFQGVAYLLLMGFANVCYFLGPLSEYVVRPSNVGRYRRVCYWLGFWFSVLLPLSIPVLLTILVLFYPDSFNSRGVGH